MIMRNIVLSLCIAFFSMNTFSKSTDEIWETPDWSKEAELSLGETRENIYELSEPDKKQYTKNGKPKCFHFNKLITNNVFFTIKIQCQLH